MDITPKSLKHIANSLLLLKGVGPKSSMKMAISLLTNKDTLISIQTALDFLQKTIHECENCYNYTDNTDKICDICKNSKRDSTLLCIVESFTDLIALESLNEYSGIYHVLGSIISPVEGKSIEQSNIDKLCDKVRESNITEIIIALPTTVDGDATALKLSQILLSIKDLKITKVSTGIPIGYSIESVDSNTLSQSIKTRTIF